MILSAILSPTNVVVEQGGVSRLNDLLGGSPALQSVAASRPSLVYQNGNPALRFDGSNDQMSINVTSVIKSTKRFAFAFWIRVGTVAATHYLMSTGLLAGTSASCFEIILINQTIAMNIYTSNGNARRATSENFLSTSQDQFATIEFDGDAILERDRLVMTGNLNKLNVSFSNDGAPPGSTIPPALRSVTGNLMIGDVRAGGIAPFNGTLGDIYVFDGMAESLTGGFLKPETRRAVANLKPWRSLP